MPALRAAPAEAPQHAHVDVDAAQTVISPGIFAC